jgi:hypothetical protein
MAYFVVRPKAELDVLLQQNPAVLAQTLTKIFYIQEASQFWYGDQVPKLLYLAHLHHYMQLVLQGQHQDIFNRLDDRRVEILQNLLGEPPYTRQLFDRWWILERLSVIADYRNSLKQLPLASLEALEETELKHVAQWLQDGIERKKEDFKKSNSD